MNWSLFLIPVCTAFSCWLVLQLFLTVLFRPALPKSLLGFRIQGILPAQQSAIAQQVGEAVATHLFSGNAIVNKLNDPSQIQKIMPLVEEHIDDFLRNKLKKQMPFIGAFIGDKTIGSLKQVFMTELETIFPSIIGRFAGNIVNDLNIQQTVTDRLTNISLPDVEKVFYARYGRSIRLAKMAAIIIGLLCGLLTTVIICLIK